MQSDLTRAGRRILAAVMLLVPLVTSTGYAANPALRRALGAYFVFAQQSVHLKNLNLVDACNIGVNCAQPNSSSQCGIASFEDPQTGDGSQIAGDQTSFTQGGGSVYQVFRNGGPPLTNVQVRLPGAQPDGSDLLTPLPILPDADGDGNPSCGPGCVPDDGDLERACGFPDPFPACNPGLPMVINPNADCPFADTQPGNSRCDLPAGTYGDIQVRNLASVTFGGGVFNLCSLTIAKSATVIASSASTLNFPAPGGITVSDQSTFGQACGDFTVRVKGGGPVTFGKSAKVVGTFCAPETDVQLGHGNQLTGQFIGDTVHADVNDQGRCCGATGASACFDVFAPTAAHVGDTISLTGTCDLSSVTQVTICGILAPIVSQTGAEVKVTVPAGASGACTVAAHSTGGVFVATGTLTVS